MDIELQCVIDEVDSEIATICENIDCAQDTATISTSRPQAASSTSRMQNEREPENDMEPDNDTEFWTLLDNLELEGGSCTEHEEIDESFDLDFEASSKGEAFTRKLASICIRHNLTHNATDEILTALHEFIPNLPKTARSLLCTPRSISVEKKYNGDYYYLGLEKAILQQLPRHGDVVGDELMLSFNIDGIPLFNGNNGSMWPVTCCIDNIPDCTPFVVALYSGSVKSDVSFLTETIDELNVLLTTGLNCKGTVRKVKIKCVVCDAPARCFVKCTKLVSGYNGCDRCDHHGTWDGRVIYLQANGIKRTNETFRNQSAVDYHQGKSPFCKIPANNLDLVSQFSCDYMHCVCLGVMRRLMICWFEGPRTIKISHGQAQVLSDSLISMQSSIPEEFARKPRTVAEIKHWKATEFRQFLLYTGPHVLKAILRTDMYLHFMKLSIGISILLSPDLTALHLDFARAMLESFVMEANKLYGDTFLVYNVLALTHISDDAHLFGSLDNCSAFKYENFLQQVKKTVRGSRNPVCQVVKRLAEFDRVEQSDHPVPKPRSFKISAFPPHNAFTIDAMKGKFCIVMKGPTRLNAVECKIFTNGQSWYTEPCDSRRIGQYMFTSNNSCLTVLPVTDLTMRAIHFREKEHYVFLPLLHVVH